MMIEDFGTHVASVWQGLRLTTRRLVERALQSTNVAPPLPPQTARTNMPYDARADWELSRLLLALDERAMEAPVALDAKQARELRRTADACAAVLQNETQSAEVFAQLVTRTLYYQDYKRIDALADMLFQRFAPTEICELARYPHAVVRALAHEALAQLRTATLVELLCDPIDADTARAALECQAAEYNSEDAHRVLYALEIELNEDDEM